MKWRPANTTGQLQFRSERRGEVSHIYPEGSTCWYVERERELQEEVERLRKTLELIADPDYTHVGQLKDEAMRTLAESPQEEKPHRVSPYSPPNPGRGTPD